MLTEAVRFLQAEQWAFVLVAVVIGLIVGSFLNVVIHRLPRVMEREWREQCKELMAGESLGDESGPPQEETGAGYGLAFPGSQCPHCEHPVRARDNIPILGYLVLKGRCRHCGEPIGLRYPIVEALSGVMAGVVAWHFGFGAQGLAGLALTWALLALTFIDLDEFLLPDGITLPFLWLGILLALFGVFVDLHSSVIGAMAGYLVLWSIYQLFRLLTGKEGMGYGDFKLLALLGAWLGWQALPAIVLLSSLVGAVAGIALIAFRGQDRNVPIPFGPYLAVAGWIALLWGDTLIRTYLHWAGTPPA
ncbi:MAG TPA: A24 family peptidase [Gammaproteobacteria bacterium]|nr:A24 family peptidase [Gammaproteobacteria bacterium]